MRIHVSRHEWWAPGPVGVRGRQGSDITNNKAGVGRGAVRRKKYRVCSSADDCSRLQWRRQKSGLWIPNVSVIRATTTLEYGPL